MKTFIAILFVLFTATVSNAQIVGGYFPSYRADSVDRIQYNKLTDIWYAIFFSQKPGQIWVDHSGNIKTVSDVAFKKLLGHCKANNVRLHLTIVDNPPKDSINRFPAVAHDDTKRSSFVRQCVNFCIDNGLAGVDIDWETPTPGQKDDFEKLLSDLRNQLDNRGASIGRSFKLSIAANDYHSNTGIKPTALPYLDYLHVMAYDGGGGSAHSPFQLAQTEMTDWANAGCPYSKMILGLPFYGKNDAGLTQRYGDLNPGVGTPSTFEGYYVAGYFYNGKTLIGEKVDYEVGKGAAGVFSWELSQDRLGNDPYSLLGAMYNAMNSKSTCVDGNEPNNDTRSATNFLSNPLNQNNVTESVDGIIPDPNDQDWYKIPVDGKGTLTLSLTNFPADYDLELYPYSGLSGGTIGKSYNTGTASELLTYSYDSPQSTMLYAKVYPKNPSQYNACGKYHLTLNWTSSTGTTCATPQPPTAAFGSDICGAPTLASSNLFLSFSSGGGSSFRAQISKYPYGASNIVYTSPCQPTTSPFTPTGLTAGMLYRWNMYAYGATDCTSCQSNVSNTKYFGIAPLISSATTQLQAGSSITLTTQAQSPGSGASINYRWLKDGAPFQQGANLTSVTVNTPGNYTLIIDYSGFADCSGTTSTGSSNSINITAGSSCSQSVAPTSVSQTTSNGTTTLTAVGGSLGNNAAWKWYSGNCGGTYLGAGTVLTVNPAVTTDYFVRAENDCNITDCAKTTVTVGACTPSTAPTDITQSTTNTVDGPAILLTVNGSTLGTNATWRWYVDGCGKNLIASGHVNNIYVTPTARTTYYVRAEGDCNITDCASITVDPVGGCVPSVGATSISQQTTDTPNGPQTLLTLNDGSLGTNATWRWYTESCGGTIFASGHANSIIVTPNSTTTYYVRAEGDCNTTGCASITVNNCTMSTLPTSLVLSSNNILPGAQVQITEVGGFLGSGASWLLTRDACDGPTASSGRGSVFTLNPTKTTTYYLRGVGICGLTDCMSVTVNVVEPPTITSVTPLTGGKGATITIYGSQFIDVSDVTIGGTQVQSFTVVDPNTIMAVVGAGASGDVAVTTPGGTVNYAGFTFLPAPAITAVSPLSGKDGTVVKITGTNFQNMQSVTFGGKAAGSYTLVSSEEIDATVSGGSSGDILVKTDGGQASFSGFVYYPKPQITAADPLVVMKDGIVTITGKNLSGTSAVSFGGTPAASFTVNSATSVSATVGDGTSGNIFLTTKGGTATFSGFSFVFSLPADNFNLSVQSVSCSGNSDGAINVEAKTAMKYSAALSGPNGSNNIPFVQTLSINNLPAGDYHLCITISGQSNYQQCYDLTVGQPQPLSVLASANPNTRVVNLDLSGGGTYYIQLNGNMTATTNSRVSLRLASGNNEVVVTTDKPCQGAFKKTFQINPDITPYPVPFQDVLHLNLGGRQPKKVSIKITELMGKDVLKQDFRQPSNVIQLDVKTLANGFYILQADLDGKEFTYKIEKR
ncbi:glycosyl hydrolase family 18 protein [Mucilaginibacter sp. L3T2-6]|uniref:glycosyl hydrolase family 18 protein n=1 Tax=Mucilaginibacter sp. L3T2-6 TaxID=3062491 RepID=UPI0026773FED|nr:glycosyl hydrolase family 18 protein [Mucilaginibacter sp. L3T2-6]MDO3641263.1 glycosyl hydrolase family 18 protein [Mucilaginibacter sp. L3T2-6]MDV6213977.1 glycosyl hydrolase family 18 protein [Mucilaginibacter sp. L3T2-6]